MSSSSKGAVGGNVIEQMGERIATVVERWMPSPFLFAIILSYLVFAVGIVAEGAGVFEMVEFWYDGFWGFLTFAMQMVLILMTGFVIAYHPRINDLLVRLAKIPTSSQQAVVLVAVFSMVLAWFHWGFSLIIGAIFAREMGKAMYKKGVDVHYPILCVAGYMGLGLTWHWGLSGSATLLLTDPQEVGEGTAFDMVPETVPASATIFSGYGIVLTILSIIFAAVVLWILTPSAERSRDITDYIPEDELFETATDGGTQVMENAQSDDTKPVPAERLDNSRILGGVIALTGLAFVGYLFVTQGIDAWTLNAVNFSFLMAGIALYTRPAVYRERFGEASSAAAGVILLFPFFAGIQGMMASSGLVQTIADGLLAISSPETFPVIAWITSAFINLLVPSGGGQWIVLGPSVLEAGHELGIATGHATMAYAVGDAHTNLLNPFWALPLLAITRIKAREMFGYAVAMMLALIPFLAIVLYLLPYDALTF